jgi:hypothetical protein
MRAQFQEKALLPTPLSKQATKSVPLVGGIETLSCQPCGCISMYTTLSTAADRAVCSGEEGATILILAAQWWNIGKTVSQVGGWCWRRADLCNAASVIHLACGRRDKDKPRFLCGEILKVESNGVENQAENLTTHTC